jgi:hypothetical protein
VNLHCVPSVYSGLRRHDANGRCQPLTRPIPATTIPTSTQSLRGLTDRCSLNQFSECPLFGDDPERTIKCPAQSPIGKAAITQKINLWEYGPGQNTRAIVSAAAIATAAGIPQRRIRILLAVVWVFRFIRAISPPQGGPVRWPGNIVTAVQNVTVIHATVAIIPSGMVSMTFLGSPKAWSSV